MITLTTSPHGSFRISQLAHSVAICEGVNGDKHGWGNGANGEPAFITYVGCAKDEVKSYVRTFNSSYQCEWCEVRKPRYLTDFEAEIKIRGMRRYSDEQTFGLDYLIESEEVKYIGCDYDEYQYYVTGYLPRW